MQGNVSGLARLGYRLACVGPLAFWAAATLYPMQDDPKLSSGPVRALFWALCCASPLGALLGAFALARGRRAGGAGSSYAVAAVIVGWGASLALYVGLPSIQEMHRASRRPTTFSCLSNLKQLGTGMMMYAQDYDQRLPPATQWNAGLYPYVKNERIFRCPETETEGPPTYAMNYRLSRAGTARLVQSERTVLLFDAVAGRNLAGARNLMPRPSRHPGRYPVGFLDGHARIIPEGEVAELIWTPVMAKGQRK